MAHSGDVRQLILTVGVGCLGCFGVLGCWHVCCETTEDSAMTNLTSRSLIALPLKQFRPCNDLSLNLLGDTHTHREEAKDYIVSSKKEVH